MNTSLNIIQPGLQLFTKDGRRVGNAIVLTRIDDPPPGVAELWLCETDFGSRFAFVPKEIDDEFWTHAKDGTQRITDPETWRRERSGFQLKQLPEGFTAETGAKRIALERERQMAVEGWAASHDDEHTEQQLLRAGICYAMAEVQDKGYAQAAVDEWPWDFSWFKNNKGPIGNLVKVGALIAAEIDRLLRLQNKNRT